MGKKSMSSDGIYGFKYLNVKNDWKNEYNLIIDCIYGRTKYPLINAIARELL